ncbi:hypothetical protein GGR28_002958 [Lewinella aquimaris]|uniref:Lipoprotein n=1 Tax=Neolewinella aquimaris TaxID=1835722 RepID=A0A840E400_9BACT|nr:hypothetical protein [Neolewinella aquimaris]MBB4080324.1 hypothetical protein [Neolewinella aquimaris]
MRYLLVFLSFLVLACGEDDFRLDCPAGGIGLGEQLILPDDSRLELVRVNDNRCPCDVQCIWAGYLQATLTDGDTTLRVADVTISDSLGIVDVVQYRGFTISIDTVQLKTGDCRTYYTQDEYCIAFTFE